MEWSIFRLHSTKDLKNLRSKKISIPRETLFDPSFIFWHFSIVLGLEESIFSTSSPFHFATRIIFNNKQLLHEQTTDFDFRQR